MDFEFNVQPMPTSLLSIDDLGNYAIEAKTEEDIYFYLIAKSALGIVTYISFGPLIPDVKHIPSGYCCNVYRGKAEGPAMIKEIKSFLLTTVYNKKHLCEANLVDEEVALDQLKDIKELIRNFGDEEY